MDNKNLSKRILLKKINGHLRNSTVGVVIIVLLAVLMMVAVHIDSINKAKVSINLVKESQKIEQEAEAKQANEEVFEKIDAELKIVCWGDDLSNLNGKSSFTNELQRMLDNKGYSAKVINMNVPGDTTKDVMVRSGALRMLLNEDITIPAAPEQVELSISVEDGSELTFLQHGDNRAKVKIGEIWGLLTYNGNKKTYFFERNYAGDKTVIAAGTAVVTKDSLAYKDFFPIISVGMNGGWNDDEHTLIAHQQAILDSCTYNQGNFLMLGFTSYGDRVSKENLRETEQSMANQWGQHYMNIRGYLSEKGVLESSGIALGEQDLIQLNIGIVPDALKKDEVNLTESGQNIVGQLIYYTMENQGCLPQQ